MMRIIVYINTILKQLSSFVIILLLSFLFIQCTSNTTGKPLNVHRIKSSESSFFSNSYIIEGENSLVLVDVHMDQKDVEVLINNIKKFQKPLEAVIITHRHTDHINGLEFFAKHFPQTPILSGSKTTEAIRLNRESWNVKPANIKVLSQGATRLTERDFDISFFMNSESPESLVIYDKQSKSLITGDLVLHNQHLWLAEGKLENWLKRLNELKKQYDIAEVYPGHGAKGGIELVQYTENYINYFQEVLEDSHTYSEALNKIIQKFPNHVFPLSLNFSLNAFGLEQS